MSSRSLLRNIFSNWIVLGASIGSGLVLTPVVVRALDTELYGVWSFLNGLLAYSAVLYMGLGSAVVRQVARLDVANDRVGLNRLISTVITIYGTLGALCLIVFSVIGPFVPRVFGEPLTGGTQSVVATTCVLLGAQLFCVFIGSAFGGLLAGHDRFDLVNGVSMVAIGLRLVAVPMIVGRGNNPLVTLAAVITAVSVVQTVLIAAVALRHRGDLSLRLVRPTGAELRDLYGFGIQSFLILFSVRLISYTDTTVIGVRLGVAAVAFYNIPLMLVEQARSFVGGFASVFLPRLTVAVAKGDRTGIRSAYVANATIAAFLSAWLGAGLICLGPEFVGRWVGPQYGGVALWVLIYLAAAAFAQVLSSQAPLPFYQALHLVSVPASVLMLEAGLNLALSLWLARRMGIAGVALATTLPAVLVSAATLPLYLCRKLEQPFPAFLGKVLAPAFVMFTLSALVLAGSGRVLGGDSYVAIVVRALLTVPIAWLVFHFMFPATLRQQMLSMLRGVSSESESKSVLPRILDALPEAAVYAVYRIASALRPSFGNRSQLIMCWTPENGVPEPATPKGYRVRILSGTTAPEPWLRTLHSAGLPVTDKTWTSEIVNHRFSRVVVMSSGDEAAGTAAVTSIEGSPNTGLVTWVGIASNYQGKGLSRPLIEACLRAAAEGEFARIALRTDDSRLPAIKSYLRVGFRPCLNTWDWTHRARWWRIRRVAGDAVLCAPGTHHDVTV